MHITAQKVDVNPDDNISDPASNLTADELREVNVTAEKIPLHVVKAGETLSEILGTSNPGKLGAFMRANGLTSDVIHPGDILNLGDYSHYSVGDQALGQATLNAGNDRLAALAAQQSAASTPVSEWDSDAPLPSGFDLGAVNATALPEIDQSMYVERGFVKQSYDMAVAGYSDPNATLVEKGVNLFAATVMFPTMVAEEAGRGILNAPYLASRTGQMVARGNLATDTDTKVISYLDATSSFAGAFDEAAGVGSMMMELPMLNTPLLQTPVQSPVYIDLQQGAAAYSGIPIGTRSLLAADAAELKPIQSGEITTFQDFVDRSVVGDNIEGHELWQHANLRAQGLATDRLSTAASQENPVIALDRSVHQEINAAQRAFNAASQTPIENINANAEILRQLNVAPESSITQLQQMAISHAKSLGY